MNIELGKTYETRSGRTVRIVCVDRKDSSIPSIGLLLSSGGCEGIECYRPSGHTFISNGDNDHDLIREHIPVTYRWANVYEDTEVGNFNKTEKETRLNRLEGCVGTIKLAFDPSGNLIVDKCEISATASSVATAVSQ